MIVVIQRVREAAVSVDGAEVARIDRGMLVLAGIERGDDVANVAAMAEKVATLRIFEDPEGRMNLGLPEVAGSVLAVSQFTLAGDIRKGRRPSFDDALPGPEARPLFDAFVARLRQLGVPTRTGVFGAMMQVALVNDGPVTLVHRREPATGQAR